jgi:hypothetical protein
VQLEHQFSGKMNFNSGAGILAARHKKGKSAGRAGLTSRGLRLFVFYPFES